jgi:hypothetical protein
VKAGSADRTQRLASADRAHQFLTFLPDESHEVSIDRSVLAAIMSLLLRYEGQGESTEGDAEVVGEGCFRILLRRYWRR